MLTDYENKVMVPKVKAPGACPACGKGEWRKFSKEKGRERGKYLICRGCGHVEKEGCV